MKFNVNQKELQEALSYCQGVIEKRSTLQILSNVLLNELLAFSKTLESICNVLLFSITP